MRATLRFIIILMILLGFVFSSVGMAKNDPPEITEEGLELIKDSKLALVYAVPDADLSGYQNIMLLEPHVAFKKNWQRDQNRSKSTRVTDKDMENIRTRLAKEFTEVFAEVLQQDDGYTVVKEAADNVLLLRPAIINLDVNAPDLRTAGRSRTYARDAGEMTLYLEVYDSLTNALIAKALDRKRDRHNSYISWQTSVQNTQAAKRILRDWAETLRDGLDEASAETAGSKSD